VVTSMSSGWRKPVRAGFSVRARGEGALSLSLLLLRLLAEDVLAGLAGFAGSPPPKKEAIFCQKVSFFGWDGAS